MRLCKTIVLIGSSDTPTTHALVENSDQPTTYDLDKNSDQRATYDLVEHNQILERKYRKKGQISQTMKWLSCE